MSRSLDLTWFDPGPLKTRGRLALSRAPGSGQVSVDADLDDIAKAGITLVVCLQEAYELDFITPGDTPETRALALRARGARFLHAPIEDFNVPDRARLQQILDTILSALDRGEDVLVHCWAGLGRAGTIAACALVARGMSPIDAILLVRWIREGAIQSASQEALIASMGDGAL